MLVRLVSIFVLTIFLSFAVHAGDPAESVPTGKSSDRSDTAKTLRKRELIGRNFTKQVNPQDLVPIGGSVRTPLGIGIPNATIILMDMDGNIQYSGSASLGFFVLPNVVAGEMYVLSVRHPRYIFAFPAQVIEVNKPKMDFEFIGERNF